MGKKRSKGVTFWGWVFIIFNIIGLLQAINYKQHIQIYGIGLLVFGVILGVAYLICGIFIIKLNEIARKAAIFLGVISILSSPFYIKSIWKAADFKDYEDFHYAKAKQRVIEQIKPEYQQAALENMAKSKEFSRKALPIIIVFILAVPILVLELSPIFFFTRHNVKERFK